jgi:hypothetical protein
MPAMRITLPVMPVPLNLLHEMQHQRIQRHDFPLKPQMSQFLQFCVLLSQEKLNISGL